MLTNSSSIATALSRKCEISATTACIERIDDLLDGIAFDVEIRMEPAGQKVTLRADWSFNADISNRPIDGD